MIFDWLKQQRRRRLQGRPFPKEWLKLIQRHVAFFPKLSANDRAELLGHIQVFLAEKRFEGCAGFAITDEVRVTIRPMGSCLEITVEDDGVYQRTLPFPEFDGQGHRGLHLMAAMVDDFSLRRGTQAHEGTIVTLLKCKS